MLARRRRLRRLPGQLHRTRPGRAQLPGARGRCGGQRRQLTRRASLDGRHRRARHHAHGPRAEPEQRHDADVVRSAPTRPARPSAAGSTARRSPPALALHRRAGGGRRTRSTSSRSTRRATSTARPRRRLFVDTVAPAAHADRRSPTPAQLLRHATFPMSGTAEAGASIEVREGAVRAARRSRAGGNWSVALTDARRRPAHLRRAGDRRRRQRDAIAEHAARSRSTRRAPGTSIESGPEGCDQRHDADLHVRVRRGGRDVPVLARRRGVRRLCRRRSRRPRSPRVRTCWRSGRGTRRATSMPLPPRGRSPSTSRRLPRRRSSPARPARPRTRRPRSRSRRRRRSPAGSTGQGR